MIAKVKCGECIKRLFASPMDHVGVFVWYLATLTKYVRAPHGDVCFTSLFHSNQVRECVRAALNRLCAAYQLQLCREYY
jgi:hypothetical protein